MDQRRNENRYTINPETGWTIKVETPTWKPLATKYYIIDGTVTDQLIPVSWTYRTNKVWDENTGSMKAARKPKHTIPHKRVSDPKGERKYLIVGSKSWNERYLEYEWNGCEFSEKRRRLLPEFITWWRRDERYDETNSSLCFVTKPQKNVCQMWFNHPLDIHSLIITP